GRSRSRPGGCDPAGVPGIPHAAAVRPPGGPAAGPALARDRRGRHGHPDLHQAANGLMRRSFPKFLLALGVLGAATVFMVEGRWPWQRLSDVPTTLPIVVTDPYRVVSDTLHSGETVSALLARQGVTGLDFVLLARSLRLDPRSLRAELPFSFHRDAVTDQPTRIEFRPDGDQRLRFIRTSSGWEGESVPIR